MDEKTSATITLLFLNRASTCLWSTKASCSSSCSTSLVQAISHLFKEVRSSKPVRVEKVFTCFSFWTGYQTVLLKPGRKVCALESPSVPSPSAYIYLVEDSTAPLPASLFTQINSFSWTRSMSNPNLPLTHFITLLILTPLDTSSDTSLPSCTYIPVDLPSHVSLYMPLWGECAPVQEMSDFMRKDYPEQQWFLE